MNKNISNINYKREFHGYQELLYKMNDIRNKNSNKNSKGQYHGYQEWYYNTKLIYRGNYKNNESIGYAEYHGSKRTRFNII